MKVKLCKINKKAVVPIQAELQIEIKKSLQCHKRIIKIIFIKNIESELTTVIFDHALCSKYNKH